MSKHAARRNIRGGVAAGVLLTAATVGLSFTYAHADSDAPGPAKATCADALVAYTAAQNKQATDKKTLDDANAEFDTATSALAQAKQNDALEDTNVDGTSKTDPAAPGDATDKAVAAAQLRVAAAGKAQTRAQAIYTDDVKATAAAKTAADTACTGKPGTPGAAGVDARIVLSPGVCARAVVTTNPAKLVRIVALIPCPPAVPPAPPAPPVAGQPVQEISTPAPTPQTVPGNLPVTH